MRKRLRLALAAAITALSVASTGAHAKDRYLFGHVGLIGKYSDHYELRFGVAAYDTGIFSHHQFNGAVINTEILFPSPSFLYWLGSPRPTIGADIATAEHAIHFGYAGLTWDTYFSQQFYTTASLGLGVTTAKNLRYSTQYKALGCRVLFHLGAGVGFDINPHASVQLYADHFSNADLCKPNNGAESAGIRFAYRF